MSKQNHINTIIDSLSIPFAILCICLLAQHSQALNIQKIATEPQTSTVNPSTEPSSELTCRAKAKEIAAETYRLCVTENRNAEIEKIRKDYQERLKNLKLDYEKEIEKLSAKNLDKSEKIDKSSKAEKQDKSKKAPMSQPSNQSPSQIPTNPPLEQSPAEISAINASLQLDVQKSKLRNKAAILSDDSVMDIPEPIPIEMQNPTKR